MILSELLLAIESVTDMDLDCAAAVGRAYDQDPELRPLRVGGDPARIKVEGSLEDLIRRNGLPIDWLTVRTNSRRDGFEGYALRPHVVEAGFLRSWTDAEGGRFDRVAALFARLCEAIDGCYGIAMLLTGKRAVPPVDVGLGDIGWLNFFGPAFVDRFPRLREVKAGVTHVANGGVVIRIAAEPWNLEAAAKQPVIDAVGEDAFVRVWGFSGQRGIHVPSYEDHMRHSPGTMEMPWVRGEIERAAANAERTRERRHASARKRRLKAAEGRDDLPPVARVAEWSTSFDADDWRSFGKRLFRRLGGELAGPIGKALVEEIGSAPVNLEESVVLAADIGPVEVGWFIDDIDTVDIYLLGPNELTALVDGVHEAWSEG